MTGLSVSPPTTEASAPPIPAATTITRAPRSRSCCSRSRWIPATPTSKRRSTRLPRNSAGTAASSATGISEVPAVTTRTVPFPRIFGAPSRTTRQRAFGWACDPRSRFRRARIFSSDRRVTRTPEPVFRIDRAIVTICPAVFPSPKITSGTPCRIPRWWSTCAPATVSYGNARRRSNASSADTVPAATSASIFFRRSFVNVLPSPSSSLLFFITAGGAGVPRHHTKHTDLENRPFRRGSDGQDRPRNLVRLPGGRDPAGKARQEPADGRVIPFGKANADLLRESPDLHPPGHEKLRLRNLRIVFHASVVFILDLPHHLLDHVLRGNDPGDAAELVHHRGEGGPRVPERPQQLVQRHQLWDEERLPQQRCHGGGGIDPHDVEDVEVPDHMVDPLAIHGVARIPAPVGQQRRVPAGGALGERHHLREGAEHILPPLHPEVERPPHHHPLVGLDVRFAAPACLQQQRKLLPGHERPHRRDPAERSRKRPRHPGDRRDQRVQRNFPHADDSACRGGEPVRPGTYKALRNDLAEDEDERGEPRYGGERRVFPEPGQEPRGDDHRGEDHEDVRRCEGGGEGALRLRQEVERQGGAPVPPAGPLGELVAVRRDQHHLGTGEEGLHQEAEGDEEDDVHAIPPSPASEATRGARRPRRSAAPSSAPPCR